MKPCKLHKVHPTPREYSGTLDWELVSGAVAWQRIAAFWLQELLLPDLFSRSLG